MALAILAIIVLALCAMMASSVKLTNLSRERNVATNAVRAYMEQMRTLSMSNLITDNRTPANFLPSPNALKDANGEVWKINYEDGSKGVLVTGTTASSNVTTDSPFADAAALGFPRDLDGNNTTTTNPVTDPTKLVVLPARIKLSWSSMVGKQGATPQNVVFYVCFAP